MLGYERSWSNTMMNQTKRLLITAAVAALYLAPIGTAFAKEKKKEESGDSGGHIQAALAIS